MTRETAERLDAYRQIVSRPPADGYHRGATRTQPGEPDHAARWHSLVSAYLTRVRVKRDDARDA
jgi:hypothetical protein